MISWNSTSFSAMAVRLSLYIVSRNFFDACRSSSISSSVIFSQAIFTASSSRARRTSSTSRMFFSVISATSAPLLGIMVTRPSSSSFRMASRTGVRLTPSRLASCTSMSRSPGFNSPLRIALRSVRKTTSRRGRYSSIISFMLSSIIPAASCYCIFR